MEEIKTGVTDHVDSVREHTEEIRNNSVSENNTQIANPASQNCVSL
ncbi:MAG: hypothetical protein LBF15_05765 [Candidatus Peribacteria bacterium]|jgi:hypothetical protein|nr:hypothetical protein [Candidatus Peribacteria bacterium]